MTLTPKRQSNIASFFNQDSKKGRILPESADEVSSPVSSPAVHAPRATKEPLTDERYCWLEDAKDANGNSTSSALYDPSTILIPASAWRRFTPFEEQYWNIKKDLFDTIVFFKKGKFYELYEKDAEIAAHLFDLKVTDRTNMKMAGVPEASVDFWVQKLLAHGYFTSYLTHIGTKWPKWTKATIRSRKR
jgi:DNA mismatch repair protein MSH6